MDAPSQNTSACPGSNLPAPSHTDKSAHPVAWCIRQALPAPSTRPSASESCAAMSDRSTPAPLRETRAPPPPETLRYWPAHRANASIFSLWRPSTPRAPRRASSAFPSPHRPRCFFLRSSVAHLTARQILRRADLVMHFEEVAHIHLVGELLIRSRRRWHCRSRNVSCNSLCRHRKQRRHLAARARRCARILRRAAHALGRRRSRLHVGRRAPHRTVFARRLPGHVVDLARRPQVFRRIAVAIQAPLHLQRVLL